MSPLPQGNDAVIRQQRNLKRLQRRSDLLSNLRNDTYCRIGVSEISGIGVIAIRDVPKGVKVFKFSNHTPSNDSIEVLERELSDFDPPVIQYIKDFMVKTELGSYHFPPGGINAMDISFYMNHSDEPNVKFCEEQSEGEFLIYESLKDITEGEELTQDYNNFSNNKKELFNQFPFLRQQKVKS